MSSVTISDAIFTTFDGIKPTAVSVLSVTSSLIGIFVQLDSGSAVFSISGAFSGISGTSLSGLAGTVTGIALSINNTQQFNATGMDFAVADVTKGVIQDVQVLLDLTEQHSGDLGGSGGDDVLEGSAGDDNMSGGAGMDHLDGGDGNDQLDGDDGNDHLAGGIGDDHLLGGLGADQLDGGDGADNLDGGEGDDNLVGGAGNDKLTGGNGNDSLIGGAGTDSLSGGAGNDTYTVDSASDVIIEAAGTGTGVDTVYASFNDTLGANLENLVLTGTALTGTGNAANNAITGNASANALSGGLGDDKLDGGAGNDNLIGGDGNDSLVGGAGNDSLVGGAGTDSLSGGAGNDTYTVDSTTDVITEAAGTGTGIDTVYASFNDTLGANLENLVLTGTALTGTGNAANNAITGNASANALSGGLGNDKLDGGAGNDNLIGGDGNDSLVGGVGNDSLVGGAGTDSLSGGAGNDTYTVDSASDVIIEAAGTGTGVDTVYASFNNTLGANLENLVLTGTALTGTGNAANNAITGNASANALSGGLGDDKLDGGAGNDNLIGGDGNDVLTGGAGKDMLTGGAGNDTFDFNYMTETGSSATTRDVIADFGTGDKIDLSTIDANAATVMTVSNEAFTFIGSSAFSSTDATGQVRYDASTGLLSGSTDADTAAEFTIQLMGMPTLTAASLIL